MTATIHLNGVAFAFDPNEHIDISIPLHFNGPQPNAYGVELARSKPCEAGDLVGDTRDGGSCNFEQYTFIPHCNGTHTECVGHITHERISVRDCLRDVFNPVVLVSIEPEPAIETDESYVVEFGGDDRLITRKMLRSAIGSEPPALAGGRETDLHAPRTDTEADSMFASMPPANAGGSDRALIVRTLPNDNTKLTEQYGDVISPFFSTEAIEYVLKCGFRHLLVDLPSIDRIFDNGKLSNHRMFWNVGPGSFKTHAGSRIYSTITELIFVPNEVEDGQYLLNLQIAPFEADASPSRPLLFRPLSEPPG